MDSAALEYHHTFVKTYRAGRVGELGTPSVYLGDGKAAKRDFASRLGAPQRNSITIAAWPLDRWVARLTDLEFCCFAVIKAHLCSRCLSDLTHLPVTVARAVRLRCCSRSAGGSCAGCGAGRELARIWRSARATTTLSGRDPGRHRAQPNAPFRTRASWHRQLPR